MLKLFSTLSGGPDQVTEGEGEMFAPRGIGSNWLPCFICESGGEGRLQPDMASFVQGRAGGERVCALFRDAEMHPMLDFRPQEPDWVQVKLGACGTHLPALQHLMDCVLERGNRLTPGILAEVRQFAQTNENDGAR